VIDQEIREERKRKRGQDGGDDEEVEAIYMVEGSREKHGGTGMMEHSRHTRERERPCKRGYNNKTFG